MSRSRQLLPAIAAATVVLAIACNQDRVTAPKSELRLLTPPPLSNSHPNNSPNLIVGQFVARNTSNGKTSTDSTFGFRVKWYTTYKATVEDWADQVANGFPIDEKSPIALSGTMYWRSGNNTREQTFSDTAAGPVSFYIDLAIGDTVGTVSTNGAGAISMSGTNSDGTPFWCGPAYPGTPACYRYEGVPGSVTLQRLDAEAQLTADSSSAGYNSKVTFSLKSVPAFVEGEEMALSIDNTSWTPDEDSLGGDPTDVATWGACTWTGPISSKTCTRQIRSSGTLKVVGGVNGKYFEKAWHISRTDAYPIVTASKYYVNAGQIDTFTVRMSDGSAFGMSRWDWFADSGVKQTVTGCYVWANPCYNTAIRESGRMRARVVHNGVFKYSRAHVVVGPPPRLIVNPSEASVLLGDTITFTTSAGDAPYSITGWSFRGTPISSCGTQKHCDFSAPHSGELLVSGVVDKEPDAARAVITVRLTDADQGAAGQAADSTTVSVLTIDDEGGISVVPAPGKYVMPLDSVIVLTVDAAQGFTEALTLLDDSLTSNTRTISMDKSHSVIAAARPDYLANPEIAALAVRFEALLNSANPRASYAALIQDYANLRSSTSSAHADSVFAIGHLMGIDLYGADMNAMRNLDEFLGGTTFFMVRRGDSVVVGYEPPQLAALRASPGTIANDVDQGGKRIRVGFVNGVHNDWSDAEASIGLLEDIVLEFGAVAEGDTVVEQFYNPTLTAQIAQSPPAVCASVHTRFWGYFGPIHALSAYAACSGAILVRSMREADLVEAYQQRQAALENLPPPSIAYVDQLARRLNQIHASNRSVVLVAHSQGAMVAREGFAKLAQLQQQPLNSTGNCTAVLALASPIPLTAYDAVIQRRYVRALTVRRDILDYGGVVDINITHFDNQNTAQADWEISQFENPLGVELRWALRIHEVAPNYFVDPVGAVRVQAYLGQLFSECVNTP